MRRLRLICVLLLAGTMAHAQRQMTVPQLVSFVKSSVQLKNDDKTVADFIRSAKVTNRVDAKTVEDLQGMGVGPKTLAALRELITKTSALPSADPLPAPVAQATIPPPDPAEQKAILAEITENALEYSRKLPNFITTQVTRRYADPMGGDNWRSQDSIQEQLSYADGKEDYKVVLVNNLLVTSVKHEQLGGVRSSGEFGSMLQAIFKPESHTTFDWERWATLRGKRMHVYSFRVLAQNSDYSIHDEGSGRTMVAGYHGLIYADNATKTVMRIKFDCDGLEAFPITQVSLDMDYDFAKIEGQEFILPLRADVMSKSGRYSTRNAIEFTNYRKFTAQATITFDVADPVPEEKEQSAQPGPPKQ